MSPWVLVILLNGGIGQPKSRNDNLTCSAPPRPGRVGFLSFFWGSFIFRVFVVLFEFSLLYVEPKSFLYMEFSVESRQKNNGGVSTGERVRERREECVCVCA